MNRCWGGGVLRLWDSRSSERSFRVPATNEGRRLSGQILWCKPARSSRGALPYGQDSPARLDQTGTVLFVPALVAADLLLPEPGPCRGQPEHGTLVAVPEAAMHEDRDSMSGKDEIGPAGEIADMQTVPQTRGVETTAQDQLGSGVAAANAAHVVASALGGMDVRPGLPVRFSHARSDLSAGRRGEQRRVRAPAETNRRARRTPARHQ